MPQKPVANQAAPAEQMVPGVTPAKNWIEILAKYREPDRKRSIIEIIITATPFVLLWLLAWASLSVSYWLTLAIALPAAAFLVRLFMIQHDCGHGSFFRRRSTNDWVGRVIGVFTMTPYDVWRRSHATHHSTTGNLDHRGFGDITTLTIAEYEALPWWRQLGYRIYRNPLVLFGIGPAFLFIIQNRLPFGYFRSGWQYWLSAMTTNAAIIVVAGLIMYFVGWKPFLMIQLPILMLASSMGVWLFYIQHQFEDAFWEPNPSWTFHEAALYGSSHYDLPVVLRWFTANIGVHHVHHLYSKIPYYRLQKVLRENPELADVRRMTLWQSLSCLRLRLWDEKARKLVSFRDAAAARN